MGEISCPRGVPISLWKVLSKSYNPSQLYAIKYVSEIDNSSSSNNRNNVPSVLTQTATPSTGLPIDEKNKNGRNDKDTGNMRIPLEKMPSNPVCSTDSSGTGQDTRISLIQVQ